MRLQDLGLTKVQVSALEKKKVVSVESLLKNAPLHYYDFSVQYPLDKGNDKVKENLEKSRPFSITGRCTSFSRESTGKSMMVKLRVKDSETGNTLFVNIMSYDLFRQIFLADCPDSPHKLMVNIPLDVPTFFNGVNKGIDPSCLKQIEALNSLDEYSVRDFMSVKTKGKDGWSSVKPENIAGDNVRSFMRGWLKKDNLVSNALRWYARGLRADLAVKKAMLDDEWTVKSLLLDKDIIVGGFIEYDTEYRSFSVLNPPVIRYADNKSDNFYIQYRQIKGITPERYRDIVKRGLGSISDLDFLPHGLCQRLQIPGFRESARMMHSPSSYWEIRKAEARSVTEDLLYLALKMGERNRKNRALAGVVMADYGLMRVYASSLPYSLTDDQKKAVNALSLHMKKGECVNALVQGDVGTGKTAVAICLMLIAAGSGYQAAMAAPYTTLAAQHFNDIKPMADNLGLKAVFLSSDIKGKDRKNALTMIASGEADLIIGTHSIFSKDVEYNRLALVIEDEEHKFGVVHRENFLDKALDGAHHVTMSATPIPKSVAATIYDDSTEIITIKSLPAGRIPIQTAVCRYDKTAMDFMEKEIKSGRQCYVVCPAIENNAKAGKTALPSIEEKEKIYRAYFEPLGISLAVLTGKTKVQDKEKIMTDFKDGKTDVLMATTVIEVGINVPNASVIVITGADSFGFSTLHQLRGRVGRGANKSYCILQTEKNNEKLEFMCSTTDGFQIAEKDLELRGPGSLFGERQSGDNYYINLMLKHQELYKKLKPVAMKLLVDETGKDIIRRYEEIFRAEEER